MGGTSTRGLIQKLLNSQSEEVGSSSDELDRRVTQAVKSIDTNGYITLEHPLACVDQEINVKAYGAVGDGTTDDTSALQAALDAAQAQVDGQSRTVTVRLPRGKYVTGALTLTSSAVQVVGDGMQNSILTLKSGTNAPMLTLGGPAAADTNNSIRLADVGVYGNASTQTGTSPAILIQRIDRSVLERVYVQDAIGSNLLIEGSTVTLIDCESFSSTSHGIQIDASEVQIQRGFINDNAGWGVFVTSTNAHMTGAPPFTDGGGRVTMRDVHAEHNAAGEVSIDGMSNTLLVGNWLNPSAVADVVALTGVSVANVIAHNYFGFGGGDGPTYLNGSSAEYNVLSFGTQTRDSVYFGNSVYNESGDAVLGTTFPFKQRVRDLGLNYCLEREDFSPRWFGGDGGSGLVGWLSAARTNSVLYSADLTNGAWVNGGTVTATVSGSTTAGNPLSASGTATKVAYPAASVGPSTQTQTVTGLSIASGDRVTFSLFCCFPDWTTARAAADVHVRILDGSNAILADADVRPTTTWGRLACSFVAATSYSTLKVQIYKYVRNADYDFYYWGAMLNHGDVLPYFGTTSAPVTAPSGLVAAQARIGNGATATLTSITGITVVNGIVTSITGS